MEKSKEEDQIVEIGSQISPPSAKLVRRCVQSKLPWCKPRAEEPKAIEVDESREDCVEKKKGLESPQSKLSLNELRVEEAKVIVIEESGDCEESEDEKKKGKRRKSQRRTPKKSPVKNKETRGPITRSKGCKNGQQLKPGEESPTQSPISKNSNRGGSNSKKSLFNKRSDPTGNDAGQNMITNHSLTNLRLEAKLAAEENVRLSAGKQTHPFFTSRKATKKLSETQKTTKMEMRCWPGLDGDYTVSCPPVHVFDTLGDDVASFDWKNWVFLETSLSDLNGYRVIENASTAFDGSVEPLIFDSLRHERIDLHQLSDKVEGSMAFVKCTSVYGKDTNGLSSVEVHHSNNTFLSSSCVSPVGNLDNQQQDRLLTERLTSYYRRMSCWPECSLWTDKYQPENALEVCGNSESVRSLGEWLKSWHERVPQSSKRKDNWEPNAAEDSQDCIYEIESDMDDEATHKNVLLITGPVGSGKSAAIYACAKEQGFEVIEVNTSDLRNGAHMKQEFGQAMDSHSLNKWSFEDPNGCRGKHFIELLSNPADIKEDEEFGNGSVEVASRSCEQTATLGQAANRTLILFEDVDTVFDEDRGFISSILQLAETAKRPIILTSNYRNPVLPQILYRFVLDFTLPSSVELLSHLYMICASEKAHISSDVLEHLVTFSLGDIRKTLMLLQFWCQGNDLLIERNTQISYSPLAFDIDAAHLVMPRLVPWEVNCMLSEKIADEIDNTIAMVEENLRNMEVMQQELSSMKRTKPRKKQNNVATPVKARKKKSLLKQNQSFLDSTEFLDHTNGLHDFSDASDSPVTNAQQTIKRRRGIILSSQSDDGSADEFPRIDTMQDMLTAPISQTCEFNLLELPVDPICHHEKDNIGQPLEDFEAASVSHICDTFKGQDVSCVPESSFCSGTETNGEDAFLAISSYNTSFNLDNSILPVDNNHFDRILNDLSKCLEKNVGNACDIDVESVDGNEKLGDSQNEVEESLFSQFHLMDECSRADFNMRLLPGETSKCSVEVDSVLETWRKLRCRDDLKSCLLANRKDASLIVKHASELANLISEADIMFKSCYPLVNDILDQSMMPCDEPDVCSYYEQQMEMGSTYAEHGLCYHTSKFAKLGPIVGHESKMDLAQEMLASSTNTMGLGKLLSHGNTTSQNLFLEGDLDIIKPRCSIPTGREMESPLYNAILPTVPARLTMTLRGSAFHEYFSFMSKISKLEFSRLSESVERRKRSRASRHYLSSGPFSLSDEDVQLLAQSCSFRRSSSTMRTG